MTVRLKKRGGGRAAKRAALSDVSENITPYIQRNVPYYEVLDEEGFRQKFPEFDRTKWISRFPGLWVFQIFRVFHVVGHEF